MNLDRERAKHALALITAMKNPEDKPSGNYVNYVKGLPAAILQNGLGQAMATLLSASKGDPENKSDHRRLYNQMEGWLCRDSELAPYQQKKDTKRKTLMEAITNGSESDYLKAQGEALSYLQWLKKFASAYLSKEER